MPADIVRLTALEALDAFHCFMGAYSEERDASEDIDALVFEVEYIDLFDDGHPLTNDPGGWGEWMQFVLAHSPKPEHLTAAQSFDAMVDYVRRHDFGRSDVMTFLAQLGLADGGEAGRAANCEAWRSWQNCVTEVLSVRATKEP